MRLPRIQAFEFNDLVSAPPALRESLVEALSHALRWGGFMRGLVRPFSEFVAASHAGEILDLGSGAGAPAQILARDLARLGGPSSRFILTDLVPQVATWTAARRELPGAIEFAPESVDAARIPEALGRGRARSLIHVLHHFPPAAAREILADAVRNSEGVFVAEAFGRNPLGFVPFMPIGVAAMAAVPWLALEHRLAKALLTYLLPINFLAAFWDGMVSTLRIYELEDLQAMVAPLGDRFVWRSGRHVTRWGARGLWLYGVPRTPEGVTPVPDVV